MKTKSIFSELVVLLLLSLVPLPGPPVTRAPCPSDRSALVRSIVNKKWLPILQRYGLQLPIECPFHPMRDIFWPRQTTKLRHRPSQWSCGLCGKSFYNDRFLDYHFESRHPEHINMAEDAVCLADYCDIMRCTVWETTATQSKSTSIPGSNTDLEVWKDTNALIVPNSVSHPSPTALQAVTAPRGDIAPFSLNIAGGTVKSEKMKRTTNAHCTNSNTRSKKGSGSFKDKENNTADEENSKCSQGLPSYLPGSKEERLNTIQRFKANCRPETFLPLQARCESLVWDCLAGLITNLTSEEFKVIESEMNRAVCWYLTCDRYWENNPNEKRKFPWMLLLALVTGLALVICLCYYLIWLMCDSDDRSSPYGMQRENSVTQAPPSTMQARGMYVEDENEYYTESPANAGAQGEHYIYVTYPPELKRRLLESCYNRTTRI